jgi:hypothetical protein
VLILQGKQFDRQIVKTLGVKSGNDGIALARGEV